MYSCYVLLTYSRMSLSWFMFPVTDYVYAIGIILILLFFLFYFYPRTHEDVLPIFRQTIFISIIPTTSVITVEKHACAKSFFVMFCLVFGYNYFVHVNLFYCHQPVIKWLTMSLMEVKLIGYNVKCQDRTPWVSPMVADGQATADARGQGITRHRFDLGIRNIPLSAPALFSDNLRESW